MQTTTALALVASEVRAFLEPRFVQPSAWRGISRSEGYCFDAAELLAYAFNQAGSFGRWTAGEGVYVEDVVAQRIANSELCTWSDIEDAGAMHGWVLSETGDILVDVTADQFGLAPVIVMSTAEGLAKHWLPRYFPMHGKSSRALVWIDEWRAR